MVWQISGFGDEITDIFPDQLRLMAELAADWKDGVRRANESLDSGAAVDSLERMVEVTNRTGTD